MEEQIRQILSEAKLKKKKQYSSDPYGFLPDQFMDVVYWDLYRNQWTTEEQALEGYVIFKLTPTINKLIKEL